MARNAHVLIAGGGIGGLTAALALLRRGFDVDVYEQASELAEVGAGIQIAANGTRVLIDLGLKAAMEAVVCPASLKEVRIWNTGRTYKLFDLGEDSINRFGAPYWFVHRGDLHRVLRDAVTALKADAIHTGARCVGFVQDGAGVTLELEDGRRIAGDVLVGSDGVHSRLRSQMFDDTRSSFLGIIAWRGLAPMSALPSELQRSVGTNWLGPGGHVITYPLRRGEILNFVGFGERADWTQESWTERGTHAECAADFPGWHPLVHEIIRNVDQPFKWALVGREPLQTWTQGRAALLGDACHPTLPFLAQGAIMAMEDGYGLARCLEAIEDPAAALVRYEQLRVERTTKIVRGSAANAQRFHNPVLAQVASAEHYVETEWAPDKVRLRYDWLFEYDATKVPVV